MTTRELAGAHALEQTCRALLAQAALGKLGKAVVVLEVREQAGVKLGQALLVSLRDTLEPQVSGNAQALCRAGADHGRNRVAIARETHDVRTVDVSQRREGSRAGGGGGVIRGRAHGKLSLIGA